MFNFMKTVSSLQLLRKSVRHCSVSECGNSTGSRLGAVVDEWKTKLERSNVPEAEISVQLIISHVLGISNLAEIHESSTKEVTDHQRESINRCCECRLARVPLQYIIKEWDFRCTRLKMIPPVFIPRPETEGLVDLVKRTVPNFAKALEIGCGSGAISISLLKEVENLQMTAIDRSEMACNLTRTNARQNEVEDRLTVHCKKLTDDGKIENLGSSPFDVIISNPPYVLTSELQTLEPEIKLFEDLRALDGGADGLRIIKAVFKYASENLARNGFCFVETHCTHGKPIEKWLGENNSLKLQFGGCFKDVYGVDRFVVVSKID